MMIPYISFFPFLPPNRGRGRSMRAHAPPRHRTWMLSLVIAAVALAAAAPLFVAGAPMLPAGHVVLTNRVLQHMFDSAFIKFQLKEAINLALRLDLPSSRPTVQTVMGNDVVVQYTFRSSVLGNVQQTFALNIEPNNDIVITSTGPRNVSDAGFAKWISPSCFGACHFLERVSFGAARCESRSGCLTHAQRA